MNIKRLLVAISFVLSIAFIGFYIWLQSQYVVPILMYHSISSADTKPILVIGRPDKVKLRLNIVSPKSFDKQMAYLKNNGYQVIPLDDFVEGNKMGRRFPHKTVVITFDDGYVDNYTNAFPILKQYHLPATIFLITDFVGQKTDMLNWEQVKEMSQYDITFGSHTRHHAYIPSLSKEHMKDEIIGSKHVIEDHLGKAVDYFAYPCGGFNEQAKAVAALAGYKAALSTNRGTDRYNIDLYELSRIHVNNWDNEFTFWSKLSGFYDLFRHLRPSH
jgi:peptidoglycan/xylan/chitin deacetylase (PgdA/CDA1 family)